MKIDVVRNLCSDICTIGDLFIDGLFTCYTLEDVVRPSSEPKVFGETAIPYGTYPLVVTFSPHFQRDLPLLVDVPGFSGVRIHPGNTVADTEGCLLLGLGKTSNSVTQSVAAFNVVFPQIRDALQRGEEVWINYK